MAKGLDLKTVVKHLVNGSLGDSLCVVCLLPLTEDNYESIFTSICKLEEQFCVADILRDVCQLKFSESDHYNVCCYCFQSAVLAYRFHLKVKSSFEILNFYTDQLSVNIENLEINEENSKQLFCIQLPDYNIKSFDFSYDGIGIREMDDDIGNDDDEVIVVVEDGETIMYHVNNEVQQIEEIESDDDNVLMIVNERQRKKRDPLMSISCLHCPVRYRFVSKLKEHMKKVHDADIYYCKICKLITDKKNDYEEHLTTHIGKYQCTECNTVYSKEASLVEHLKTHEINKSMAKNMVETGNICEICGVILEDEIALEAHRSERHVTNYTCYYCGRMYKGQVSFEAHIQKHEKHMKKINNQPPQKQETKPKPDDVVETEDKSSSTRAICGVCGKSFVDERSLLWHQRLHNNDRPFVCNICSRGFVSVNRRNQHMLCAHSRPSRRCPLCPALFHLRSMVNTHLKKVHLNRPNKRRTRAVKHTNVYWKTETVPIQELSVSIQNEVMEMQSTQEMNKAQTPTRPAPQHTIDTSIDLPNATPTATKRVSFSDWMKNTDLLTMQEAYALKNDYITMPLPESEFFKRK